MPRVLHFSAVHFTCTRKYTIMGTYLCVLLASDNTYDYETLSEGYAHQNI